tara:strand:+ start:284 stop:712 length:429 start_codon:yes stop_codon:yes gene_type:complete
MNKENNVVVKLEQHNSNRQIGLEAYEKLARNFMNVLEEVTGCLALLEVSYWEAFTKYPWASKYNKWEKHPKLKEYEIHEKKIKADKTLKDLMKHCLKEEDRLSNQILEKYGVEVLSKRQQFQKESDELDNAAAAQNGGNDEN